ncbi:MAG: hypothetical protein AABZ31_08100 [Bdellovibrionota bacterium]
MRPLFGALQANTTIQRYISAGLAMLILVLGFQVSAGELESHPGYLSSVKDERYRLSMEVVIVPQLESTEPSFNDEFFTKKMNTDIRDRYERGFGRTQGEQIQSIPSQYFDRDLGNGQYITHEEYQKRQERFGRFMTKRLGEYYSDKTLKKTSAGEKVYDTKEAISNISGGSNKRFGYKLRYSVSGNDFDLKIQNPYNIETKVNFDASDVRVSLAYPVSNTVRVLSDYETDEERLTLSGVKTLRRGWATSLTGTTSPAEDKFILGLSWAD